MNSPPHVRTYLSRELGCSLGLTHGHVDAWIAKMRLFFFLIFFPDTYPINSDSCWEKQQLAIQVILWSLKGTLEGKSPFEGSRSPFLAYTRMCRDQNTFWASSEFLLLLARALKPLLPQGLSFLNMGFPRSRFLYPYLCVQRSPPTEGARNMEGARFFPLRAPAWTHLSCGHLER